MKFHYRAAFQWQSRAVLGRHLTVYRRNWYTAALPPIFEPIILLLAFGVGLGGFIPEFAWRGQSVSYLAYLAPGMLADMLAACTEEGDENYSLHTFYFFCFFELQIG
ncbi:MAG: hypothetical protein HC808_20595 [Candidatus Competibacteraceae bacterium]|nr:hypothetical protein [Candidatus Competibacteraceae bacterium]